MCVLNSMDQDTNESISCYVYIDYMESKGTQEKRGPK